MTSNKGYQIWLKQDGVNIWLPENPEDISVSNSAEHGKIDICGLGKVTIPQDPNNLKFTFSADLPASYNNACQYRDIPKPEDVIKKINVMKQRGQVRFIITNTWVNYLVSVEKFDLTEKGGVPGTWSYTLELEEWKESKPNQVSTSSSSKGKVVAKVSNKKSRPDNRLSSKSYTVKKGDCLWSIGKRFNANYLDIAKKNNIKSPYIIHPGQRLKL